MAKCPICGGTGMDNLTKEGVCSACKGTGKVEQEEEKCSFCNGTGDDIFDSAYCVHCGGTGIKK